MASSADTAAAIGRLLPPEWVARLQRLELVARSRKQGLVSGRHTSPDKGASVEFDEHRMYVAGDDPRHLDWRLFAKSDRYMIRQYVEETNLRGCLVVDASASMAYVGDHARTDSDGHPRSKFDVATRLAAALGYLLLRHQDAAGLATFGADHRAYLPPSSRHGQLHHLLERLVELQPDRTEPMAPLLHQLAERLPRHGMVVVIGDFFEDVPPLLEALHHLRFRRHEVLLIQVLAHEELAFPFDEAARFTDLEAAVDPLQVDPGNLRAEYLEQFQAFRDELRLGCERLRADLLTVDTSEPLESLLADFLARRMKRR